MLSPCRAPQAQRGEADFALANSYAAAAESRTCTVVCVSFRLMAFSMLTKYPRTSSSSKSKRSVMSSLMKLLENR